MRKTIFIFLIIFFTYFVFPQANKPSGDLYNNVKSKNIPTVFSYKNNRFDPHQKTENNLSGDKQKKPALIVLITIDQLRNDLLDKYNRYFTGGFRKLLDTGFRFTNTMVEHAPTNSLPGHVTIATGCYPGHHGIIDNSWLDLTKGGLRSIYAVGDPDEKIVGYPELEGVSPKNIEVPSISDWFLEFDSNSKTVNIGTGEISSLLHGGHKCMDVYWLSYDKCRFVTSTFYRKEYPDWVRDFNNSFMPKIVQDTVWTCDVPEEARRLARKDNSVYEFDGKNFSFPHRFKKEVDPENRNETEALYEWLIFSPSVDKATIELSKRAVKSLALGKDSSTDYLSIVVSMVDHIGHRYGPLSLEIFDLLLKMDKWLNDFFEYLDKEVGEGMYIAAITADHGAAEIPEYRFGENNTVYRITSAEMDTVMKKVRNYTKGRELSDEDITKITAIIEKYDFIGDVMTDKELADPSQADSYTELYKKSYYPNRVPVYPLVSKYGYPGTYGLRVRFIEGAVPFFAPSTHGSPYEYDRHVPFIVMGTNIKSGKSSEYARTIDVAPTLAKLAGISVPEKIDGKSLKVTLK